MSETFDDDGCDGDNFRETENSSLQRRYSRSKLFALRYNDRSQRRPDCASRSELQTLSFWKTTLPANSGGHERTHGANIRYAGNELSLNSGAMLSSQFSINSSNRARERQFNVRGGRPLVIARCGNATVGSAETSSYAPTSSPSQKASFLDQRTSSITHLMPAFAKKRIAAAAAQKTTTSNQPQNNHGIAADHPEFQDNEESRTSRVVRSKEIPYEQQKICDAALRNDVSPRRNLNDTTERDNSGSGSVNTRQSMILHERRIGSGRLLPRDVSWDYHEKNSTTSQLQRPTTSTRYSAERSNNSSVGGGGYHEKNSFDRKSNAGNENYSSNTQHTSNRRYNLDEKVRPQRHNFKDKNDEPEWYSGGPTSQNDIIELRGFDEPTDDSKTENSSENAGGEYGSSNADLSQSSSNYELTTQNTASNAETEARSCTETPNDAVGGALVSSDSGTKEPTELTSAPDGKEQIPPQHAADMSKEFNFDVFLNLDSLDSQIMHNSTDDQQNDIANSGSRFSRWFANSNTPQGFPDEKPSDQAAVPQRTGNVLEFFQNAKIGSAGPQKLEMPSVEELEAKMRKVDIQEKIEPNEPCLVTPENGPKVHPASEDMEAFKKILQQLNEGGDAQRANLQHESIPRCVVSPPKQALIMGFIPPEMCQNLPPPLLPVTPDNYRFAPPPMSPSSQHIHINNGNPRLRHPRDVLVDYKKQIDFVNLVHAVNRGQIPLVFLEKELNNPNVPIPTKEVIAAVIHEIARSFSPVPSSLLRRSPINLNQQRIHSPTATDSIITSQNTEPSTLPEIQPKADQMTQTAAALTMGMTNPQDHPHARSLALMQNAMMKKKIEEQQQMDQNRRQSDFNILQTDKAEQQSPQHQAHINNLAVASVQQSRHLNSPTPLAFTPTSVLRKMTADKDNTNSQIQHLQLQQQQQQQFNKLLHETQNKLMNPSSGFLNQNSQQLPSAIPQPRMILGGNHVSSQMASSQQQQPQQNQHLNQVISPQTLSPMLPNLQQHHRLLPNEAKWQMNLLVQQQQQQQQQQQALNKPMGRPILKGPPSSITLPPANHQQPMHILGHLQHPSPQSNSQVQVPSMIFPGNLDMPQQQQQQQRLNNNQTPQHILNPQSPAQGFVPPPPQLLQQPISQMPNSVHMPQQQQLFHLHHMTLQQQQHMQLQRQLHQHLLPQPPTTQPQQQHETKNRAPNFAPQSQPALASPINNAISNTSMVGPREGDLSPTSNQLAQWFSPELLAQASAGKLPQINMNQALSLEEFERNIQQHSSTVVHN